MSGPVCRVCNAENHDGAKFCSACGATLTAPKKQSDPLIDTTLAGKFRIEKLLGNGAMGRVYQATHLALQRGVAIKVMHDHLARSGEFATRFVREARAASQLDHPNSIRVLDFGKSDAPDGGLLYLVMELFPGTDLYELLRQESALDIPRAAKIVTQILSALEDAHAIGLIHRDLKPENVLVGKRLDGTEIAKICDFGIAKLAEQEGPKLSQVGTMIGTPLYMSPEAACGRETDARSDLYSVGVILYEVMTGTRPFDAPAPLEVARMQVEEPPQPPTQRAPNRNISPALERVILKALAKAPKDRQQSARELRESLETALRGGAPVAVSAATVACTSCGAQIALETRFCAVCGAPRTTSASKMAAVSVRTVSSQGSQPGADRAFSGLSGLVPDSLLGDIRRASTEAKADRRTLAVLALDLIGTDDGGDPDELATRIGDRFELVERVMSRFGAVLQGAGGTRVTAFLGVDASPDETEALIARAVEAVFALKKEGANPRWLKAGIASGIFRVTGSGAGPQFLGTAAQQAARAADQARSLEVLIDESIRSRVGEGYTATPSRGGFFLVREDFSSIGNAQVIRPLLGREAEVEQLVQ
ncbi:MAG: protein kinase, partial [Polyangiales bacterium]